MLVLLLMIVLVLVSVLVLRGLELLWLAEVSKLVTRSLLDLQY